MADINDWLTAAEAARLTGYNIQYIRRLVRSSMVESKKWGRDWMISRTSLLTYQEAGSHRGPRNQRKIDRR
jgi:excisionase family DNA binding protein